MTNEIFKKVENLRLDSDHGIAPAQFAHIGVESITLEDVKQFSRSAGGTGQPVRILAQGRKSRKSSHYKGNDKEVIKRGSRFCGMVSTLLFRTHRRSQCERSPEFWPP